VVYPNVPGSFVAVAKKVNPSVVNIFTAHVVRQSPFFGMPGLEELFGHRQRERVQRSLGSGFIVDSQGFVLTNYHVVRGADSILVQMEDGRHAKATPVGAEPAIDVALLHIDMGDLTPAVLGDSEAVEVGEWVLAVGNPFGLSHTVTSGIVSAKGRKSADMGMAGSSYQDFIQTDASINPGNSGGPLVNVAGEVIGINTAIAAAGEGIGFAVPINMVKTILAQLKHSGRVVHAWIGVGIRELASDVKKKLGIPHGVMVTEIFSDGPAVQTGLRPGDIVVSFNDKPIDGSGELAWMTNTAGIGNMAALGIRRGRETIVLQVKVAARPVP